MEKIYIPEEVAYYLASKVKSNIRELEGCLIRLGAQASLTGKPINKDMAKTILHDLIEEDEKPITTDHIQKVVCEHFALKLSDMKAKKRTKEVALPAADSDVPQQASDKFVSQRYRKKLWRQRSCNGHLCL